MGYSKGRETKSAIVDVATKVTLARGFSGCSMYDLSTAAGTTMGKITHHFPSKHSLFEEVTNNAFDRYDAGRLADLSDESLSPARRIEKFLDDLLAEYALQEGPIGCLAGLTAIDPVGATDSMRERALSTFVKTRSKLEMAFLAMGKSRTEARNGSLLVLNTWQGAVLIARAGAGIQHLKASFTALKVQLEISSSKK